MYSQVITILSRLKPMTYKIDTCRILPSLAHLALVDLDKDSLALCQDNATEWDIRSLHWNPDFLVGQLNKITINAHCHESVPIQV